MMSSSQWPSSLEPAWRSSSEPGHWLERSSQRLACSCEYAPGQLTRARGTPLERPRFCPWAAGVHCFLSFIAGMNLGFNCVCGENLGPKSVFHHWGSGGEREFLYVFAREILGHNPSLAVHSDVSNVGRLRSYQIPCYNQTFERRVLTETTLGKPLNHRSLFHSRFGSFCMFSHKTFEEIFVWFSTLCAS